MGKTIGEDIMPTENCCCDEAKEVAKEVAVESNTDIKRVFEDLTYEYRPLIIKLYALKEFNQKIKNGIVKVSATQEKLLAEQETYMSGYAQVLDKRLNDLLGI